VALAQFLLAGETHKHDVIQQIGATIITDIGIVATVLRKWRPDKLVFEN
jgi:hypothetical protein